MNLSSYSLGYTDTALHTDLVSHTDPVVLAEIANDKGMSLQEERAYLSRYDRMSRDVARELLITDTELFEDYFDESLGEGIGWDRKLLKMALQGVIRDTVLIELTDSWAEKLSKSYLVTQIVDLQMGDEC